MAGEVVMVGGDCGDGGQGGSNMVAVVSSDGGDDAESDCIVRSVVTVEVTPGGQVVTVARIMLFPFC